MAVRAKRFEYAVTVDPAGRPAVAGGAPADLDDAWSAEHLVLAGLVRCSLTSLRYHARRTGLDVRAAEGSASGAVTKRDEDGRYAFVELECELAIDVEPRPDDAALEDLLAKAERDCFVGASLTVPTRYRWRVNGEET